MLNDIPTASVRSVGVCHAMWLPLPVVGREGEPRPAGPAVANETILECGHMKSVSMPSALLVDAGAGAGRLAMRAGSVKERRTFPLLSAAGACSASVEGGVGGMAGVSGGHLAAGEGEGAVRREDESEAEPQSSSWASSVKGVLSLTGVGQRRLALPLLRNGLATGKRTSFTKGSGASDVTLGSHLASDAATTANTPKTAAMPVRCSRNKLQAVANQWNAIHQYLPT